MYFACNYTKVVGMKEALEVLKLRHSELEWPNDSYSTYIEDPDTLETSEHQFVLGEGDKAMIMADTNRNYEFNNMVNVYCHVIADVSPLVNLSPSTNYNHLKWVWDEFGKFAFGSDNLKNWLEGLPHSDLFTTPYKNEED